MTDSVQNGFLRGPATANDPFGPLIVSATGGGTQVEVANDTGNPIPVSKDTTANSQSNPLSTRLTDGTTSYDAAKTGQLPAALVSGRLDVNLGASAATVTVDTEFDKATAATQSATTIANAAQVAGVGCWTERSAPAADAQASASKAAGAAGVRHICTGLDFTIHTVAAPTATTLTVALRDGATGAGTILWSWSIRVPATADLNVFAKSITGLSIVGTAATAMTLEFSAGLASTIQVANLTGYSV
jgi:hypothetical protein